MRNRTPRSVFFLLFTLSGFAGLIYESIWTQYLKLFLGHAAYAQTLVLALFMGGMALGSWVCARYGERWPRLLAGYALVEGVIGLAALAFHPLFASVTQWAYLTVLPAAPSGLSAALIKWLLAGLLILPQSVLLGMTFPLMSAGLIRRFPASPGETIALLYFTNSLGGAVGVLASGFLLVERLGLPGTVQAAGALNLALALTVLALSRGVEEARPPPASRPEFFTAAREQTRAKPHFLLVVAALTGSASFIYEIGWIRMLTLVLGASTHSFELMLSAFIFGLALGGLWIRRRIDHAEAPERFLGWVQWAMGLLALATLPMYGKTFDLMAAVIQGLAKTDAGYVMFLGASHAIALAVMLPATFCAGMTLPLITTALFKRGYGEKSVGAVYAANTLGSIVGVVFAAHVGLPMLGLKGLIAAGAAIDMALGVALLARSRITSPAYLRGRLEAPVSAALGLLALVAVLAGVALDPYLMASGVFRRGELYREPEVHLVMQRDGKTSTVSLVDFPEGRSLRTNGKSDGAIAMDAAEPRISDEVTMVLTAAIPLALQPQAAHVAVIGLGTGLTTHTLLAHPGIERVDTIEIEPAMAEASRLFAPYNANAFADPRSNIVFEDAKTYFSTGNRHYDLILSEPSNPWVSGVSSLFTREFYQLARRHLEPGGVLAQWIQMYETDTDLIASVLLALGQEFPDYAIYATTNNDLLILAGERGTLARPLADITRIPSLSQELRRVHVQSLGDIEMRRLGGRDLLSPLFQSFGVPANSDYAPYLDLRAAKKRFLQHYAGDLAEVGSTGVPVAAMLEGRRADWSRAPSLDGSEFLTKIDALRRAVYAREALLGQPLTDGDIPAPLLKDLEIARQRPACGDAPRFETWFNALFQVNRAIAALLPPRDAMAVWTRIGSASCPAQSAAQSAWLALLRAVAGRDAPHMAALAERLLDPGLPHSEAQVRYLLMAGMTGLLALGKKEQASGLWKLHSRRLSGAPDLSLRLLQAHASAAESAR